MQDYCHNHGGFFFSFGSPDFRGLLTRECGGRLCESLCESSFERVICGLQKMSELRDLACAPLASAQNIAGSEDVPSSSFVAPSRI